MWNSYFLELVSLRSLGGLNNNKNNNNKKIINNNKIIIIIITIIIYNFLHYQKKFRSEWVKVYFYCLLILLSLYLYNDFHTITICVKTLL